ncbi:HAD family hydrolase [Georgenia alba]|uniref:HAD family hydrolase n=1 Tax=Georgenia alba TaxID=2233858 RepID=A0ABW2QCM6_9MICO
MDVTDRVTAALGAPGSGVLLDLDGTLVDSEPTHRAAFDTYFSRRGWEMTDELYLRFVGRRGLEVLAELDGPWREEDPQTVLRGLVECVDREAVPPLPVPGAAAAIAAWRDAGVPVAVVTSAWRDWAVEALGLLGVAELGLPMVTWETVTTGKPAPEPYRRGAELLGLDPAGCVAFEDSPAGLTAAVAAGVGLAVGVTTTHPAEALLAAGADGTLPDLTSLVGGPGLRSGERRTSGP